MPTKPNRAKWAALMMSLLLGAANIGFAAEFLTAADWQFLKSLGYEEHSDAFEKATRGQRKHLHRLINNQKYSAQRKRELINSYLFAVGVGAPMR
jgi:hypothetical protein